MVGSYLYVSRLYGFSHGIIYRFSVDSRQLKGWQVRTLAGWQVGSDGAKDAEGAWQEGRVWRASAVRKRLLTGGYNYHAIITMRVCGLSNFILKMERRWVGVWVR
jgi:hypothetical protein